MLYRILLAVALTVLARAESAHADNSNLEENSRKTVACAAVTRNDYVASLLGHHPSDIFRARRERLERYRISSRTAALSRRVVSQDLQLSAVRPPSRPLARTARQNPRQLPQETPSSGSYIARASYYGPGFHGRPRKDGKPFNQYDPTVVAHRTLALGTKILATDLETGRSGEFVVRDRGPFHTDEVDCKKEPQAPCCQQRTKPRMCKMERDFDFSLAGAQKLGFKQKGVTLVHVQILSHPNSQGAS